MVKRRAVDDIIAFLTSFPGPSEVLNFQPPAESQERLTWLLDEQNARDLTGEEKQELDYFILVEHIMRLAKASARKRLA